MILHASQASEFLVSKDVARCLHRRCASLAGDQCITKVAPVLYLLPLTSMTDVLLLPTTGRQAPPVYFVQLLQLIATFTNREITTFTNLYYFIN